MWTATHHSCWVFNSFSPQPLGRAACAQFQRPELPSTYSRGFPKGLGLRGLGMVRELVLWNPSGGVLIHPNQTVTPTGGGSALAPCSSMRRWRPPRWPLGATSPPPIGVNRPGSAHPMLFHLGAGVRRDQKRDVVSKWTGVGCVF